MLDSVHPGAVPDEGPPALCWPGDGMGWVRDPRKSAPGLDALLIWAFRQGAHRINFQPGHQVSVKIHGRNHRVTAGDLDEFDFSQVVNHLYAADGMARLEGGSDFDTAYPVSVDRSTRLRFRLNGTPTRTTRGSGGNVVIRPIADMPPSLSDQLVEAEILDNYNPDDGMVVVSGATGSGKSTLIAGFNVAKLRDPAQHRDIVEGAAPVEFLLEGIRGVNCTMNQSEIPRDLPTFAAFTRGAMRREPNDIIVGECRDSETMSAAIQAALSGHLLTTTTHSRNVPLTMQRIASLCPAEERDNLISAMAQSLRMIVNQRLVPSADGRRTPLREFLVFDEELRWKLMDTDPKAWPSLTRRALEEQGQSYRRAIEIALRQGRITEQVAAHQFRQVG